jgi:hypothetical protein
MEEGEATEIALLLGLLEGHDVIWVQRLASKGKPLSADIDPEGAVKGASVYEIEQDKRCMVKIHYSGGISTRLISPTSSGAFNRNRTCPV